MRFVGSRKVRSALAASTSSFAASPVARSPHGTGSSPSKRVTYVRFEIPVGWLTGRAEYVTEPSPSGTVLTSRMQFQAHGFAALLEPLLSRILARDSRRDEERLKRLLERGTAPLGT
jgi:hypothetical protein